MADFVSPDSATSVTIKTCMKLLSANIEVIDLEKHDTVLYLKICI